MDTHVYTYIYKPITTYIPMILLGGTLNLTAYGSPASTRRWTSLGSASLLCQWVC